MTDEQQSPSLIARLLAAYAALPSAIIELQVVAGGADMADVSITLGSGGRVAVHALVHGDDSGLAKERWMTYDGALVSYYDGDPPGQYFQVSDSSHGGRLNAFRACNISVGLKFLRTVLAFFGAEDSAHYNHLFGDTLRYSEPSPNVFVVDDEMGDRFVYEVDPETMLLLGYVVEVVNKGEMRVPFRHSHIGEPMPDDAFAFKPPAGTTARL